MLYIIYVYKKRILYNINIKKFEKMIGKTARTTTTTTTITAVSIIRLSYRLYYFVRRISRSITISPFSHPVTTFSYCTKGDCRIWGWLRLWMMNVRNDNIGNNTYQQQQQQPRNRRSLQSYYDQHCYYAELILVCNVLIILYSYHHPLIILNNDYIKSE